MTPAPEAERPLPCPFCGAKLKWSDDVRDRGWHHPERVTDCAAEAAVLRSDQQIAAWNRRAPEAERRSVQSLDDQIALYLRWVAEARKQRRAILADCRRRANHEAGE